jgi:aspartate aminotransferase
MGYWTFSQAFEKQPKNNSEHHKVLGYNGRMINKNVKSVKQSPTMAINVLCSDLEHQGREICRLGLGQSPFPVPKRIQKTLKKNAHRKAYLPTEGLPELREAICRYHWDINGLKFDPDLTMVAPGSKELIFILQMVSSYETLIPAPSWVSYAPQATILGKPHTWVPAAKSNGYKITGADIEASVKKGRKYLLILNSPSNPTGGVYSESELKDLSETLRKHKILVLSDEIYGRLHHRGEHKSLSHYYPEGTIVSDGLSKWCGAGGWRLGCFNFPPELRPLKQAMKAVASEMYSSASAPIQYAAVEAFLETKYMESYLQRYRKLLRPMAARISDAFDDMDLTYPAMEGGFYAFPSFDKHREALCKRFKIQTSAELCTRLLEETGIALLPGSAFGLPESELSVRLAYVNFNGDKALRKGSKVTLKALDAWLPKLAEFLRV